MFRFHSIPTPAESLATSQHSGIWLAILLIAVLVAWLPIHVAAMFITGIIFALVLLLRPVIGLFALTIVIPFSAVLRLPLGMTSVGITDLLVGATGFAWFLQVVGIREQKARDGEEMTGFFTQHAAYSARLKIRSSPLLWLILPFGIVLLYSTLSAQSLEHAIPELIKWAEVALIYFLGVQLLDEHHRLPFVLFLLMAAAGEAFIGIRQFVFGIGPEAFELGRFLRAYGSFGQPNPYAGYLGLALPLGLALSLWAGQTTTWLRRKQRGQALPSFLLALFSLSLTAIIAAGIVASWSRGAWLGVAVSTVAVLALYSLSGRILVLLGSLAVILALPVLPPSIVARLFDVADYVGTWNAQGVIVTDENFSIIERVAHWQVSWEMFADHPWLGIGVGNWDVVYPRYMIDQWFDSMGHAHNVLFHYAAIAGILGVLTYLWLWLGSLVAAFLAIIHNVSLNRAIAIGVFGLLVHLSVHNQLDNLWVQGMPLLVALALSLLVLRPPLNQNR
jgi:O-antigen ligase